MKQTESQKRASIKYEKNKIDRLTLRLPKGTRQILEQKAKEKNTSVNSYISSLIFNAIK